MYLEIRVTIDTQIVRGSRHAAMGVLTCDTFRIIYCLGQLWYYLPVATGGV